MSALLKELMSDFGLLREDEDVEKQVKAQLDRASKMDEVDTVTFGLETDDGRMVKVYVKAEQANDFEKGLAGKLGAVDSIEQALNELSKDFEIVAVDWPEQAETGDEAKDEDDAEGEETAAADDQQTKPEGEDVLNQQVYYNRKERDAQGEAPMSEPKESYKDKVRAKLLSERDEAVGYKFGRGKTSVGGLDAYFSYPLQFQIYKAILELGVPDVALTKSAYRQQIIQGIRRHAAEVMRDGALRTRLSYFLNQEIHQDETDAKREKASMRESVLTEDALGDFEAVIGDLLTLLDNTPDNKYAKWIMNSSQMKALTRGASGTAASAMSTMRSKMTQFHASLTQALQMRDAETKKAAMAAKVAPGKAVAAGMATEALMTLDKKIIISKLKDPKAMAKYVFDNAEDYEQGRDYFYDLANHEGEGYIDLLNAKQEYERLVKKKMGTPSGVKISMKKEEIEADGKKFKDSDELAKYALRKHGGNKDKAKKFLDLIDAKEKVNEAEAPVAWEITKEGENVVIACDAMTINVDDENTEKLVKALSNKTAVVVKDAESGNKYTFSPRGSAVRVKQTGAADHCMMSSKDVNTLLSVIAKAEKADKDKVEEAQLEEARRHRRHKKIEQPVEDEPTDEVDDEAGETKDEDDDGEEKKVKVKVKVKVKKSDDDDDDDDAGEKKDVEECDTGKKKRMSFKDMK